MLSSRIASSPVAGNGYVVPSLPPSTARLAIPKLARRIVANAIGQGLDWVISQKLVPNDTAQANRFFGFSVAAIDANTLAIGAVGDANGATGNGAVYVFGKSGGSWSISQKLVPNDTAQANRQFGSSVAAIDANTLAIGASQDNNGGATANGAVYVFVKSTGWSISQKLVPNDTAQADRFFGYSVAAIDANTLAIGAFEDNNGGASNGAVYVFVKSTGWSISQKLVPNDTAQANRFFGFSVAAIDANTLAIGAVGDANGAAANGAVYISGKSGGLWSISQKLVPNDTAQAVRVFGSSVAAIDANTLAIGAFQDDNGGAIINGAVYIADL